MNEFFGFREQTACVVGLQVALWRFITRLTKTNSEQSFVASSKSGVNVIVYNQAFTLGNHQSSRRNPGLDACGFHRELQNPRYIVRDYVFHDTWHSPKTE